LAEKLEESWLTTSTNLQNYYVDFSSSIMRKKNASKGRKQLAEQGIND